MEFCFRPTFLLLDPPSLFLFNPFSLIVFRGRPHLTAVLGVQPLHQRPLLPAPANTLDTALGARGEAILRPVCYGSTAAAAILYPCSEIFWNDFIGPVNQALNLSSSLFYEVGVKSEKLSLTLKRMKILGLVRAQEMYSCLEKDSAPRIQRWMSVSCARNLS